MISHLIPEVTVDTIIMSLKNLNSQLNSLVECYCARRYNLAMHMKPIGAIIVAVTQHCRIEFYYYFVTVLFRICIGGCIFIYGRLAFILKYFLFFY